MTSRLYDENGRARALEIMATNRQPEEEGGGALYIRWDPAKSPFTIEVALAVTARIDEEMTRASGSRTEIGGILLGRLPSSGGGSFRVEEVDIIPRHISDGPLFVMNPRELGRMLAATADDGRQGTVALGLFRSHLRNGPLRPSLADRTLLASRFPGPSFALLLVQGSENRDAALFVATKGELPEEPSVEPFHLKQAELASLPEADASASSASSDEERFATPEAPVEVFTAPAAVRRRSLILPIAVFVLSLFLALLAWPESPASALWQGGEKSPGLFVRSGVALRISWDGSAAPMREAQRAKLIIVEGTTTRQIELTREELQGGAVEYTPRGHAVKVTLEVEMPGDYAVTQTVSWHG